MATDRNPAPASDALPARIPPARALAPTQPAIAQIARCPECDSTDLVCLPYDFGVEIETGYQDAGERFRCQACGAQGDAAEAQRGANVRAVRRGVVVAVGKVKGQVA